MVGPLKTLRTAGTVESLDKAKGVLTVATVSGQRIQMLIPAKPGIVFVGAVPASIGDVNAGDQVQAVFYRPDKVVVRIEIVR